MSQHNKIPTAQGSDCYLEVRPIYVQNSQLTFVTHNVYHSSHLGQPQSLCLAAKRPSNGCGPATTIAHKQHTTTTKQSPKQAQNTHHAQKFTVR